MIRSARFLLACSFATATAAPGFAQFLIGVQQNGQAVGVANGGTIAMNAPAVGQAASATVTMTNLGTDTVSFAAAPQILGSGNFTSDAAPATVTSSPGHSRKPPQRVPPRRRAWSTSRWSAPLPT
jgi:hypothetical protein